MRLLRVARQRARSLFRAAQVDRELSSELAFHLEQLTNENIASGMSPTEARLAARRALGGLSQFEEQCRDQRRMGWLTDLHKDVLYAARSLRKSPGFSALAVLTLAFGCGASIAVYAIAEGMLLRSLPLPAPDRLVSVLSLHVRHGLSGVGQSDFRDWQASNTVFDRMAFTEFSQVTLTGHGDPERISGRAVSEGFFEMMGVAPRLGRWFTPEEQKPKAASVVILSHGFWSRKLGARPEIVGGTIYVNDRPYVVTGVMPETFRFNEGGDVDYWTPIAYRSSGRQQHQYAAYARLKDGATVRAAQAQMTEIARRLEQTYPDNAGWGVQVESLRSRFLEPFAPALRIFALAAIVVLLTACGNVASLLLARGTSRSREVALRLALGAGRARVIRLLLTESVLLSGAGAIAGVIFAWWLVRLAVAAAPPWLQLETMLSISPSLVAFAVVLTVATGLLTGLWPAFRCARANLNTALKESKGLNGLVVAEIALAVALLSFAGLLTKSFDALLRTDLGYRPERLLTFRMPLPQSRYPSETAKLQFWDRLVTELHAIPGVLSAAASDSVPLGGTYSGQPVEVEGQPASRDWRDVMVRCATVAPTYFETFGVVMRAGSGFSDADRDPVLIVNEAFVRKLLAGVQPIGARIRIGGREWRRIVGVVADMRYNGPTLAIDPEAYVPISQQPYAAFVSVRTAGPEAAILPAIRQVVRRLDAQLAMTQVRTMEESLAMSTSIPRKLMALVGGFAAITAGMATLGLAGIMAYVVSRKRREIGIKIALGAQKSDVFGAILRRSGALVSIGAVFGVAIAVAAGRLLESVLYGVHPSDPAVMAAAPLLLAAAGLLACLVPAARAAAVDPMDALRQD